MGRYKAGAARFKGDQLVELVLFCIDPPCNEMRSMGTFHEDFLIDAAVVNLVKAGSSIVARLRDHSDGWPFEVIDLAGMETLEIVKSGQPFAYQTLQALPLLR